MYRKLFLDDTHVSEIRHLQFCPHRARKHPANPVVVREHPWEKVGIQLYGRSVIYDPSGGRFRMYYLAFQNNFDDRDAKPFMLNGVKRPHFGPVPCYAESEDGIHWDKPMLNQCMLNDNDCNNIIDVMLGQSFEPGFLYDPDDPDPARRYKVMYWGQKTQILPAGKRVYRGLYTEGSRLQAEDDDGNVIWDRVVDLRTHQHGMYVAFSRDGINWEPHSRLPVFTTYSDTGHSVLRDPRSGKFVAYGRFRRTPSSPYFNTDRNVARVQSDDFINWGPSELVLAADSRDPHDTHINSVNVDLYEGMYVALMEIGDGANPPEHPTGSLQIAASHDGVRFTRVADRFAFLDSDIADDWDHGRHVKPGTSLMTVGDRIYMYYCSVATGVGHRPTEFGLATWRRDGFVSLRADQNEGELVTMPMIVEGTKLHLNADCRRGSISVEVCRQQGDQRPGERLPVYKCSGIDSADIVLTQDESDLMPIRGWLVSLRIRMKNADLYSFWFDG